MKRACHTDSPVIRSAFPCSHERFFDRLGNNEVAARLDGKRSDAGGALRSRIGDSCEDYCARRAEKSAGNPGNVFVLHRAEYQSDRPRRKLVQILPQPLRAARVVSSIHQDSRAAVDRFETAGPSDASQALDQRLPRSSETKFGQNLGCLYSGSAVFDLMSAQQTELNSAESVLAGFIIECESAIFARIDSRGFSAEDRQHASLDTAIHQHLSSFLMYLTSDYGARTGLNHRRLLRGDRFYG